MTIGVVSTGAMGSALAGVLRDAGTPVVATVADRSERTRQLAADAHVELLPDLDSVVAAADVVLSIGPPAEAETIAQTVVAAAKRTGSTPLLVDLNAISPTTARSLTTGLELVDGSISGPPPGLLPGVVTRIYLSGARANEVAALLRHPTLDARVVGLEVGTASAVKMCTASIYKGMTALLQQALLTARANGVVAEVLDDLEESLPELVDGVERTLAIAASKAHRYVDEMLEIAATQAAAGLAPALFEAMADVYAATASTPLGAATPEDAARLTSLDDVLAALG